MDATSSNRFAEIQNRQRAFYQTGQTRNVSFRRKQLRKFHGAVKAREGEILATLQQESLRKPGNEAYVSEIGAVLQEARFAERKLSSWARPEYRWTPFLLNGLFSSSRVHAQPYGEALIIGPWNYPLQLLLVPLISAIAAGNTAILKPSELAPKTSALIRDLIAKTFDPQYVAVIEGGKEETQELLRLRHDFIFFTGSTMVGQIIARAAISLSTPYMLELGGKSPCIVDEDTDVQITARRIVSGKFFNAGQSCIAPDYLLVHRAVKEELLQALRSCVGSFYGANPAQSPDYGRIVNREHFDRLQKLLTAARDRIVCGGKADADRLYIEPTIVDGITLEDPLMQEEIFGPILPVMTYRDIAEAKEIVERNPRPLALYFFSNDPAKQRWVVENTISGGVAINDTMTHFISPHLPFGGIGESGMGAYHGKAGFDAFSHRKPVLHKSWWPDILRYPPYSQIAHPMIRFLMEGVRGLLPSKDKNE